jgi:hypothetical protein
MTRFAQAFAAATMTTVLVFSAALAQPQQSQPIRGKIAAFDGSSILIDQAKGGQVKVTLAEKAVIMTVGKASLSDIKIGSFVGVGAMPQPDGSQKAVRVLIFPEMQRGTNEGHYPWKAPIAPSGSTMTNATVDTQVAGVEGQILTVKYKDGTKKIIIGNDANIVANIPGDRNHLKPGTAIAILSTTAAADGGLMTSRVNIGRGDYVP